MNGIPVYPLPKNGERPYLATSAASFLGLFFGYFHLIFYPPPVQQPSHPPIYFLPHYNHTQLILSHPTHQVRDTH